MDGGISDGDLLIVEGTSKVGDGQKSKREKSPAPLPVRLGPMRRRGRAEPRPAIATTLLRTNAEDCFQYLSMSHFFIERPIFTAVLAIVVMLGGFLVLYTLPISQYPQISLTTLRISATYTGADAQTVENTVTKVIEQGMTGIDYLDYMTSSSSQTGRASITLTFTNEADPDVAQMQVQNKLQLVESQLPSAVTNTGVTVTKSSENCLMVIGFVSKDGTLNNTDLSD